MEDTAQGEEPKTQQPGVRTLLLSEQGPRLPVGISDGAGGWAKDIAIRPWRMKEERELGDLRDKQRDANMSAYVSMVLATMCTKLGPHDFDKMKPEERRVIISQMFMPDVFHAYIYLRLHALGADFDAKVTCPTCGKKAQMTFDLNTVQVKVVDKYDDATWEYKLANPIQIRGKTIEKVLMGPVRWTTLESLPNESSANMGTAKTLAIRGSIIGLNAERPVQLADSEIDEMSKRDLEALTRLIDDKSVGPKMAIDDKCRKCSAPIKLPIDWNYDNFFASSSP